MSFRILPYNLEKLPICELSQKKADQSLIDVKKRVAHMGKEKTWENLVFIPLLYSVSAFMIQSLLELFYYEMRSWLNIYTRGENGTLNSHWQCWTEYRGSDILPVSYVFCMPNFISNSRDTINNLLNSMQGNVSLKNICTLPFIKHW